MLLKNVHCAGVLLYPLRRFALDPASAKTLFNRPASSIIMVIYTLVRGAHLYRETITPRRSLTAGSFTKD